MECRTCEFYRTKPELPEGSGQCLANPPTIVVVNGEPKAMYAAVEAGARCRHYQATSQARLQNMGKIAGKPVFQSPSGPSMAGLTPISPALQPALNVAPADEDPDDPDCE